MNPLLHSAALPAFAQIQPEHVLPAMQTLIEQARTAVDRAAADPSPATWENTIDALDDVLDTLSRAWSTAGHLNSVVNTPELRSAYNEALPMVSEFWTWLGLHQGLFNRYKQLSTQADFISLSSAKQRIVNLALKNFKLSGVELPPEQADRFAAISARKAELSQKFSENVMDATDAFALFIDDKAILEGIPEDVLSSFAQAAQEEQKNGYKISLHIPSYLPVMQYARDRNLRKQLYQAYATRASDQGDSSFDNSDIIIELLALRHEAASLLEYPTFAQMQLEMRMADSPEAVIQFLNDLASKSIPHAKKDMTELQTFAREHCGLDTLEPWDIAFVSEALRQARYDYSDQEVKQYFTEPKVIEGLFSIIQTLFKVQLTTIEAPTWHPHVRVIRVSRGAELVGHLYFDLYARPGKQGGAWVDQQRSRRVRHGKIQHPIAFLTCNFSSPSSDKPALLTHDDVITLFHEMGHALHLILSEVEDLGSSPFSSVEWDAIELPSQFMENFCWEWSVVESMSAHVDTGDSLPLALYQKLYAARNYQSGMQLVRQIEFSLFDMQLHLNAPPQTIDAVQDLLKAVRSQVAVVFPPEWHRFAHSFGHIFAGGYSAGYYSYKWAEVLSADAYAAFEEEAQGQSTLLATKAGERFLKEILAVGGERPASESFKAFRQRDPQIDALLRHTGLV